MIGYVIVGAICLFLGYYGGNVIFRAKFNAGIRVLVEKMQKVQKTEDVTLKERTTTIKVTTPKTSKSSKKELPQDLSKLSKEELMEVLKNSDVKVVNKGDD
jgi:hypothetical protein